eukprot:Lithocolla_globosa_v1_NODE_1502_length_2528_cov_32.357461.p4 type:complete len:101 gc:universal NODE_1502_length_2528_cov_32.357461:2496-2194(-)
MPAVSKYRACQEGQCVRCLHQLRAMRSSSTVKTLEGENYLYHRTYIHNKFKWLPTENATNFVDDVTLTFKRYEMEPFQLMQWINFIVIIPVPRFLRTNKL